MKKILLASASVAALFVAVPAMADDPGGNQSTVTQSGDTQSATVNQTGSNDVSTIDQQNANNTALVNQDGQIGGTSSIEQTGAHNTATVQCTRSPDFTFTGSPCPSMRPLIVNAPYPTSYPFGTPLASDAFIADSPASFKALSFAAGARKS